MFGDCPEEKRPMSYSEIYVFGTDGDGTGSLELRNSSGGASIVWRYLVRKYKDLMYDSHRGGPRAPMFEHEMTEDLWKATQDGRVELRWWEWNVLNWTYDNALIRGEDLEPFVASLRMFEEAHALPGYVCHLPAVASHLEELIKASRPRAIGLYATSVCECPWWVGPDDDGEGRAYNIDRDTKHWFIDIRRADYVKPAKPALEAAPTPPNS
jgi:hypothetical protein